MNMAASHEQIAEHLRAALEAVGNADGQALRSQVSAIVAWQEQPLLQGLARLSRELTSALRELPAVEAAVGELPDAGARLDKVIEMTEVASNTTLDLADASRRVVEDFANGVIDQEAMITTLRKNLQEMALAQSYQDLTGQIIRKVATIVRNVHKHLSAIELPENLRETVDPLAGSGPAVAGVDAPAASQEDADDLLSRLGL